MMAEHSSKLRGAIVVVTGAAGQIGQCLLAALEAAGATVIGLDLAKSCPAGDARYVACDITDERAVRATVDRIAADHGRIDILIHSAGLSAIGAFEDHDVATHRRVMEVTHLGAVSVTLAALPALRAASGRIVVIGSVAGFAPVLGRPPYVAAKHAITGLFTALRSELAPSGVRVTLAHPTFVTGGMAEASDRVTGRTRVTTGKELTPAQVAEAIIVGIEQKRDLVLIGRTARLSWHLHRFVPSLYARLMARRLTAAGDAARVRA